MAAYRRVDHPRADTPLMRQRAGGGYLSVSGCVEQEREVPASGDH